MLMCILTLQKESCRSSSGTFCRCIAITNVNLESLNSFQNTFALSLYFRSIAGTINNS